MAYNTYSNVLGLNIMDGVGSGVPTINPNDAFRGDQGASRLIGRLSRAQWEDWKLRFSPYIDALGDAATNPYAGEEAAGMAKGAMRTAYDNSQQALDMQRQGYGIRQTNAQRQADGRRRSVQQAASTVSAGNQARLSATDRQSAILAGGMGLSNIPDKVLNQ
nr:hypothetical protein [uncultured Halomonas sp.]